METNRWGGGGVLVWAGVTAFNKTQLVMLDGNVNAQRYQDQVLAPVVLPFMRRHLRRGTFQQDNAPAHRARATAQYLRDNNIAVMDWPALSPDLNPIEHVWDALGRAVRARPHPPTTIPQLRDALIQEWNNLPQQTILTLIQSMRRRCLACLAANGGHTRY